MSEHTTTEDRIIHRWHNDQYGYDIPADLMAELLGELDAEQRTVILLDAADKGIGVAA